MKRTGLDRAAAVFKVLGHPARLRMLAMLRDGPLCVCQVTAVLELATSTVSAHLSELKRAGLVEEAKEGRFVSYRLSYEADVAPLLEWVAHAVGGTPLVSADGSVVRGLRRISVEELCRVRLDVTRVGIKRPEVGR
jgi:ArsR family transcriptional regulator, arsenate/arsenite/antimonite-responsive transcriptional repressor